MLSHRRLPAPALGLTLVLAVGLATAPSAQRNVNALGPLPQETAQAHPARRGYQLNITHLESLVPSINPLTHLYGLGGGIRHTWGDPYPNWGFAELVKPLSNGHLLASVYDRATAATGKHKAIVELDWDGNVVWSFDPQTVGGWRFHHDFQRLPDGKTLVVVQETKTFPSINSNPLRNDLILEVGPLGLVGGIWSMAAHFTELNLSAAELQYIQGLTSNPVVIFHMNSLQELPPNQWEATDARFRAGNLLVSLRDLNRVFIIDRQTGAIVWIMNQTIGQHHARMIPAGLPGAGNITVFDNGGSAGAPPVTRSYSRVLEVDPPSSAIVWQYVDQVTPFFSALMGACQRLPNGNTLITESLTGRVFEITSAGKTVWEWHDPEGKLYRSYRVPLRWETRTFDFPW